MPFEIRDDVFIRKSSNPLILENYEQVVSISKGKKMRKPHAYLEHYNGYISRFLELHEQMRELALNGQRPSQRLWDDYQEAKADAITAQEIIGNDYKHEAVQADKS
jgi:hypothetical protein